MPESADEPVKQPKSTPYILGSAFLSALMIGATVVFLLHGYQWKRALDDLHAEPGVEIIRVEKIGILKRRLIGFKDPLAPPIDNILREHGIPEHMIDISLAEYHSLNTPYAVHREENAAKTSEELQAELLSAVEDFTTEISRKRDADIDRVTRILFDSKFPEAMETIDLKRDGKKWKVNGELYSPQLEEFVEEAPRYLVDGTIDFEELIDLTYQRTSELENDVSSYNLLISDLDDEFVHTDRMIRLARQYDEVCDKSGIPRPKYRFEIHAVNPEHLEARIRQLRLQLTTADGLNASRFAPEAFIYEYSDEGPSVFLKLLPQPAP